MARSPFLQSFAKVLSFHVPAVACCWKSRLGRWSENSKPHACQTCLKMKDESFEQGSLFVSDKSAFSSVVLCLQARNSRRLGKNGCTRRPARYTFLDAVTYRDARTRRGITRPGSRKSRYARFRASSVRDFDEDAQETLTERTTSTTTSRQRGICASIIASVTLCFATISIDRLQPVEV